MSKDDMKDLTIILTYGMIVLLVGIGIGLVLGFAVAHTDRTPSCTRGAIGCAPGLVSTLKAMPSYTPEVPTPGPTPTPCGGICWPKPEPTLDGPHMIYPHPEPQIGPRKIEPGHLRPVGPGYPYDVHA